MTLNEKLDVVEAVIRQSIHYKENGSAERPFLGYVRNVGSIDVFCDDRTSFYFDEMVVDITRALGLHHFIGYDPMRNRVFSHCF